MFRFKNLAPNIYRQRLVIEGYPALVITDDQIKEYLVMLSDVLNMTPLMDPVTNDSDRFGWAGWIHWETSGAHFYAWENPRRFFSVDIYTCKAFEVKDAVNFTKEYFKASKTVHRSF